MRCEKASLTPSSCAPSWVHPPLAARYPQPKSHSCVMTEGWQSRARSQPPASWHPSAALPWGHSTLDRPPPRCGPLTSFSSWAGALASFSGPSGFARRLGRVASSSLEASSESCSSFHENCRVWAFRRSNSRSLSCLPSRDPRVLGRPPPHPDLPHPPQDWTVV